MVRELQSDKSTLDNAVRGGLLDKVTSEQRLVLREGVVPISRGRTFQLEIANPRLL